MSDSPFGEPTPAPKRVYRRPDPDIWEDELQAGPRRSRCHLERCHVHPSVVDQNSRTVDGSLSQASA